MIGLFASTCPFPFSRNSFSDFREFCFRFSVKPLYARHPADEAPRGNEEGRDIGLDDRPAGKGLGTGQHEEPRTGREYS